MKYALKFTAAVIMILQTSIALAGPLTPARVREITDLRNREIRDIEPLAPGQANPALVQKSVDGIVTITNRVDARQLRIALGKNLTIDVNGAKEQVSLLEMAQAIRGSKAALDSINRAELTPDGKALVEQHDRAIVILPQALQLASVMSVGQGKEVSAFAKQLSLTKDALSNMTAAELKSHLDVLEVAIKNGAPELPGDIAYLKALEQVYGKDKAAAKIEEILGCAR